MNGPLPTKIEDPFEPGAFKTLGMLNYKHKQGSGDFLYHADTGKLVIDKSGNPVRFPTNSFSSYYPNNYKPKSAVAYSDGSEKQH